MSTARERPARALVALFFALLTLIGLVTAPDYGVPCDEPSEQVILMENLHEYAVRLMGEGSQAAQWYASQRIDVISQSIERDHGQSAYYLFAPLLALENKPLQTTLWHAYTWLWFMAGVWALYAFLRHTGLSRTVSGLGGLIYFLCPRFFAEGHYNNKDMVLLSLFLLTLWLGARLMERPTLLRGLLFSLAGAMATNTKLVGLLAFGVMGLCVVVRLTLDGAWKPRIIGVGAATVGGFFLFYALLTPALWTDAGAYVGYLIENMSGFTRWTGIVIFRGIHYDQAVAPLPRLYLPWMMAVTLPLYVLPLAAVGQVSALRRVLQKRDHASLLLMAATLVWVVPMAAAVLMRPVIYNGWRHFYFLFAGLAPLCAHGVQACLAFLQKRKKWMRAGFAALLALCIAVTGVGMISAHPHEYAYYNLLARATADEEMELDYWMLSAKEAMQRLSALGEPITLSAREPMSLRAALITLPALGENAITVSEDANAPYLLSITTYQKIYGLSTPEGYREALRVNGYGHALCIVYQREEPSTATP